VLSKKDKEDIRKIVREEFIKTLTIKDVQIEREGPDGKIEKRMVDLFQPEWIAAEIPNLAYALRGVQETADHAKNNSWKVGLTIEKVMTQFKAQLIDDIKANIKELIYNDAEILKIESTN